ncbi:MAG: Uncharacterized protein AWU56_2442 [Idiomarina sp. T82-3]|uniref:HamA C-terminal domain-containing protein n=1 Tax=Idiomarina TaxID=135575 RepID=UPI0007996814|nr:DUF1837 domain-containing protein [Idiomarina sp. T82-3]KXS33970.1 MAG: Uncharacterized protein AWU56_2442 [Idiomarina sp. T82-3]
MNGRLEPQLQNSSEIKELIKRLNVNVKLEDGRSVKTLIAYIQPSAETAYLDKFFEIIKKGVLANFVFTCKEIERKLGLPRQDNEAKLFEKAVRKLSQHTAKGELGELILFTLLDVYFEAPKLLSKIASNSSRRMPVFGADAVHGKFDGDKFELFLGESKLHQKFSPAATDAVKSISSAKENYQNEFDLIESNITLLNIAPSLEEHLIKILDPFSNENVEDLISSACFIGFSEPHLFQCSPDVFEKQYIELAEKHINDYYEKAEQQDLDIEKTYLMMLPFSCINELVEGFIQYIGIPK